MAGVHLVCWRQCERVWRWKLQARYTASWMYRLVHFCDGDFLCAEFLDESDDEAVVDVGDGAAARNEARDPELLWPGDLVSLVSFSGALRTDVKDAKEPGNVDSWATRFRILRLDGPSEGPISTEHEIGFFSDGCGRRLA